MIPSKKPTNSLTKLPRVTPNKTPVKTPNSESLIVTPVVTPPNTKPSKKPPPDSAYNNHAGVQRVRVGAVNIKPGQHRNRVKWKDAGARSEGAERNQTQQKEEGRGANSEGAGSKAT